jgi:hypothetical protein
VVATHIAWIDQNVSAVPHDSQRHIGQPNGRGLGMVQLIMRIDKFQACRVVDLVDVTSVRLEVVSGARDAMP